jgi:hypothetical protein
MARPIFSIMTAAAVAGIAGIAMAPGASSASSAAMARPGALLAYSSQDAPPPGNPDTSTTFTVTTGALSLTAQTAADLGSGAPGTTVTAGLGAVTVTDDRALLSAAWSATASATDWTTGAGLPDETIPVADSGYVPGTIDTSASAGTITATGSSITLAVTPAPVVTGTAGVGDNTATWDPTVSVAVPTAAVGGLYTGTVTQSVA